jgi:HPt (histidine-containing phosphotransfer) domain-containing protein
MLDLYEEHIPPLIKDLMDACKSEDRTNVREVAHSIKGSSGNIGAKLVSDAGLALESGYETLSLNDLIKGAQLVSDEFDKSVVELNKLL